MEKEDDTILYKVVVNHEEQYSIWPADRENALGWNDAGKIGPKAECLDHINEVWIDMRPLSLRKHMEEMEKRRPEMEKKQTLQIEKTKNKKKDPRDNLVQYLAEGEHPVVVESGTEKNTKELKACIDRGYVYIKFTDTRGGTELGCQLDRDLTNLTRADFNKEKGSVRLVGRLTLNDVKVECVADIDLRTLQGRGHLELNDK